MPDDPGLHHDPPLSLAGASFRRLPFRPVGDRLAPPDPRAPPLSRRAAAPLAAGDLGMGEPATIGLGRRFHHLGDE